MVARVLFFLAILSLSLCTPGCWKSEVALDHPLNTLTINRNLDLAVFSPDGELVATVDKQDFNSGKFAIVVWQTDGSFRYETDKFGIYQLVFSTDGKLLAASCWDGVRLFRSADGQLLRTIDDGQMFCVAFSPDGKVVAAGGSSGPVKVWKTDDGSLVNSFDVDKWVTSLAFSRDGRTMAAGTAAGIGFVRAEDASQEDNPIRMWNVSDGKPLPSLGGHKYGVVSMEFNNDGSALVSSGSEGLIRSWRVADGGLLKSVQTYSTLEALTSKYPPGVQEVSVSPDGQIVAAGRANENLLFSYEETGNEPRSSTKPKTNSHEK